MCRGLSFDVVVIVQSFEWVIRVILIMIITVLNFIVILVTVMIVVVVCELFMVKM